MTCSTLWTELKSWQPLIGAVLGFGALTWGALYNFSLNRKRDDRIRQLEALTIALALYSEMKSLQGDLAKLATAVSSHFMRNQSDDIPTYWLEFHALREPTLYSALAPKIGLLEASLLLQVTEFYSNYLEAGKYFPLLVKDNGSEIYYGVGWLLRPALAAVEGVSPALRTIEAMGRIEPPAPSPDTTLIRKALRFETDMFPDED